MAFQNSGLRWKCGTVKKEFKHYDIRASQRPNAEKEDGAYLRFCKDCGLEPRHEKRGTWSAEERNQKGVVYCAEGAIYKHFKRSNKGRLWNHPGVQAIREAKELNEKEAEGWQDISRKSKNRHTISRSRKLAMGLLGALKSGGLIKAFSRAGQALDAAPPVYQDYEEKNNALMEAAGTNDPEREAEARRPFEEAEQAAIKQGDYQACKEFGADQPKYLKALDFVDMRGPDLPAFSARRARTAYCDKKRGHISRGLSSPAKMRLQGRRTDAAAGPKYTRHQNTWQFYCNVDWNMLVDEQQRHPSDTKLRSGWTR